MENLWHYGENYGTIEKAMVLYRKNMALWFTMEKTVVLSQTLVNNSLL